MRKLWEKWKAIAKIIGDLQATIIFSILYIFLLTPFGIIASFFKDFLGVRKPSSWEKVRTDISTLEKLKMQ